MKKILLVLIIIVLTSVTLTAQSIKGKVVDKKTKESLAGVMININKENIYTDLDGNFEINKIKDGKYTITISYISYDSIVIKNINLNEDLYIELLEEKNSIETSSYELIVKK